MKFLIDNQLPPALARLIQDELGSEAVHVVEVGLRYASDDEIWKHATNAGLIWSRRMKTLPVWRYVPKARRLSG